MPGLTFKEYPETTYITIFGIRLVYRDGKYDGWYRWRTGPKGV